FFFFSSRRRHTRSKRDWSSDVCSSDLKYVSFFILLFKMILLIFDLHCLMLFCSIYILVKRLQFLLHPSKHLDKPTKWRWQPTKLFEQYLIWITNILLMLKRINNN